MKVSFSSICQLYEGKYECIQLLLVNSTFASKLRGLDGYEIVLICDDSGSMNLELGELYIVHFFSHQIFL
jgi:hypothetical protein